MPRGAATKVPKVLDIGMRVAATAAKALGNAARQEFGEEADSVILRGEITGKSGWSWCAVVPCFVGDCTRAPSWVGWGWLTNDLTYR